MGLSCQSSRSNKGIYEVPTLKEIYSWQPPAACLPQVDSGNVTSDRQTDSRTRGVQSGTRQEFRSQNLCIFFPSLSLSLFFLFLPLRCWLVCSSLISLLRRKPSCRFSPSCRGGGWRRGAQTPKDRLLPQASGTAAAAFPSRFRHGSRPEGG